MNRFGIGLALGLALGGVGAALAYPLAREGDHYETGWTVLLRGEALCLDPYVRPSEREIECRSRPRP
ncbi:hypothetical protein [Phenylobacterium sp.]|uniref:hypothetical protein n=1 Tax=Phenylobacterium sp. TaxID=1871053 RepID=UPI00120AC14C|nr:hypothetical protein [Phenylobacterium sp.]THD56407.1 MAG: hypothetical protein E8A12_14625 [Phenylobacterium sp.]